MIYDTNETGTRHDDRVKCALVIIREFNQAMEDLGARVCIHDGHVALFDVDDARASE